MEASRDLEAPAHASGNDHAGVRIPPPLIYIAGFLGGIALEAAVPIAGLPLGLAVASGIVGVAIWLALDGSAMLRAPTTPT